MKTNGVDYIPQKPRIRIKDFIAECIEKTRGDDLNRIQLEFRQYSPEQMKEEHGNSGKTRQRVLDELLYHNHNCVVAIKTVEDFIRGYIIFKTPEEYGLEENEEEKLLAETG